MLYREIIAVCSQIHTKHINTVWAEPKLQNIKLAVRKVTTLLFLINVYTDLPRMKIARFK